MTFFTHIDHVNLGRPDTSPVHVHEHSDNFPHIVRLQDGRHVAADHDGRPIMDAQGRYQTFQNPETLSHSERVAFVEDIRRDTETHYAPDADETARIRAHLAAKYGQNVAAPEGSTTPHL
ncbi:hypothetical protein [Burkholderia vietnamiensis]|uniref:hypothetical protein n=1 Tax=Burkholderia vietnamiensis TaxID=60552 RepID=UPI0007522E52|nr:hypothetical protein [Burkholderia vietnamiensis]KVF07829.1 hypothetical protein WJ04_12230 [Burkholderia vietnamiensis]KVF34771.1 hypothetical protein WJ08_05080 [Burkholderia vietnamiensis]KVF41260.1 hypothetical protein WJ10_17195 [Burkholderia vietnamiensis]KVF74578.1 hypothetical protein WJ18_24750 [Burkholderia vietnamiensis]KVF86641.1 hypothetical protein WJ19_12620 [Burkholderia vietnamiensis]